VNTRTIHNVIRNGRLGLPLQGGRRTGRPPAITPDLARRMILVVTRDRRTTINQLRRKFNLMHVSGRTISKALKAFGDSRSYWTTKAPLIVDRNRIKRRQFARRYLNWTAADWSRVLWSDESPFVIMDSTRTRCRRRPGERYHPQCITPTVKHQTKLMVWGCFSGSGLGEIHRIRDKHLYQGIILGPLSRSIHQLFPGNHRRNLIFMQDNDPKHTSHLCRDTLRDMRIRSLHWPAQSPDLNPIENLWRMIKVELKSRPAANIEELWQNVQDVWNSIEPAQIQSLIESMPRRMEAVLRANGGPTKY